MLITQKSQYALRALYELARRRGDGPVKISEIAGAQKIPHRFLEVILSQLRRSGMVDSKRGYHGGYVLSREPEKISVGDVLRFLQQTTSPEQCIACETKYNCPFMGDCVFMPMWNKVRMAIFDIYDKTTIQELLTTDKRTKVGSGRIRKKTAAK
ncbi:MAG: RrF2 family transcriptional regulator [Thermodesulfobacteriota bacterium]